MRNLTRKVTKLLAIAAAACIAIVFISDIFGGGGLDEAALEDSKRSEEGTISMEPFTVEPVDEPGSLRTYPDLRHEFAVPRYGVRVDLRNMNAPPNWDWDWKYASNFGSADLINQGEFVRPTDKGSSLVYINARERLDAVANPLIHPETREPVTEVGDLFILDGVAYTLTAAQRVNVDELQPGVEPVVQEDGRALVMAFLLAEDGQPSGEAIAFTLHRSAD